MFSCFRPFLLLKALPFDCRVAIILLTSIFHIPCFASTGIPPSVGNRTVAMILALNYLMIGQAAVSVIISTMIGMGSNGGKKTN